MRHIVILGAGFGGLHTYLRLRKYLRKENLIKITIVNNYNYFLYVTMLHEAATGSVSRTAITQAIREIMRSNPYDAFYQGTVKKIDPIQKTVITDRGRVNYDILVVALGSKANFFNIPGASSYAFTLKTLSCAIKLRNHIINSFELASKETSLKKRRQLLHFVIIGGGYTGVELAGQLADLLYKEFTVLYPEINKQEIRISLVAGSVSRILPQCGTYLSNKAIQKLKQLNIKVIFQTKAERVGENAVYLTNGTKLETSTAIWTGGVKPNSDNLLPKKYLDEQGYIKIKTTLQSSIDPNLFAIGDIAAVTKQEGGPYPLLAQVAQVQGKHLAKNIYNLMRGRKLIPFRYFHKGDIIPIGDWFALADIMGVRFTGRLAWFLRRLVFLQNIFSWTDRIQTLFDWSIRIFKPRDTSQI